MKQSNGTAVASNRDIGKRAAWVWSAMEDTFGAKRWRALRGEQPSKAWVAGLAFLTDEEIRHGVRAMLEWHEGQPPDWPEFRSLCRPPDKRTPEQRARDAQIAEGDAPKALPTVGEVFNRQRSGSRWRALMILDGHLPRPAGMTGDDLDAMLGDSDVEDMRERNARERHHALRRMGVEVGAP